MKYIGTSWKMNNTPKEAAAYAREFRDSLASLPSLSSSLNPAFIQPFIIPPFVSIETVRKTLPNSVLVGAQNMHWEDRGAFTGEISAPMLKDISVNIVEIGHSERRQFFNETDHTVGLKTQQALRHGITPLVCIGESAEIKAAGKTAELLEKQIKGALNGALTKHSTSEIARNIMFAYEPVWAIGEKGTPASPDYIGSSHARIRRILLNILGEAGQHVPILYGGSVNTENAQTILTVDNCDGLFVGRAAWNARGFIKILSLAQEVLTEAQEPQSQTRSQPQNQQNPQQTQNTHKSPQKSREHA